MSDILVNQTDPHTILANINQKLQSGELSLIQGIVQLQGLFRSLREDDAEHLNLMALITHRIAVMYSVIGDTDQSNKHYQLSRGYFERLGRTEAVLHTDLNIALNQVRYGRHEQMAATFQGIYERGTAMAEKKPAVVMAYARLYRLACLIRLGNFAIETMRQDVKQVQAEIENDAEAIDTENFERLLAEAHITLVDLAIRKQEYAAARQSVEAAKGFAQADHILLGMVNQTYGEIAALFPDSDLGNDANQYFDTARNFFNQEKTYEYVGHAFFSQGYCAIQRGQQQHARYFFRQAISYYAGRNVSFRLQQAQHAVNRLTEHGEFEMPKPFFVGE
jgi:tetratricopeptide (TPR) repeat protein